MAGEQWRNVTANVGSPGQTLATAGTSFGRVGSIAGDILNQIDRDKSRENRLAQQALTNQRYDDKMKLMTPGTAEYDAAQRAKFNLSEELRKSTPEYKEQQAQKDANRQFNLLDAQPSYAAAGTIDAGNIDQNILDRLENKSGKETQESINSLVNQLTTNAAQVSESDRLKDIKQSITLNQDATSKDTVVPTGLNEAIKRATLAEDKELTTQKKAVKDQLSSNQKTINANKLKLAGMLDKKTVGKDSTVGVDATALSGLNKLLDTEGLSKGLKSQIQAEFTKSVKGLPKDQHKAVLSSIQNAMANDSDWFGQGNYLDKKKLKSNLDNWVVQATPEQAGNRQFNELLRQQKVLASESNKLESDYDKLLMTAKDRETATTRENYQDVGLLNKPVQSVVPTVDTGYTGPLTSTAPVDNKVKLGDLLVKAGDPVQVITPQTSIEELNPVVIEAQAVLADDKSTYIDRVRAENIIRRETKRAERENKAPTDHSVMNEDRGVLDLLQGGVDAIGNLFSNKQPGTTARPIKPSNSPIPGSAVNQLLGGGVVSPLSVYGGRSTPTDVQDIEAYLEQLPSSKLPVYGGGIQSSTNEVSKLLSKLPDTAVPSNNITNPLQASGIQPVRAAVPNVDMLDGLNLTGGGELDVSPMPTNAGNQQTFGPSIIPTGEVSVNDPAFIRQYLRGFDQNFTPSQVEHINSASEYMRNLDLTDKFGRR